MKLSVPTSELREAMALVRNAAASRATLPVLGNVLINATEDLLTLTCTNLEIGIRHSIKAKVDVPGTTTVSAKKFSEIVSSLYGACAEIDLSLEKGSLIISTNSATIQVQTIPFEDFPPLGIDVPAIGSINRQTLVSHIQGVAYAASLDEARPIFQGVNIECGETMTFAATDGFRVAIRTDTENKLGFNGSVIVPAKALNLVEKLFQFGNIDVAIDNGRIIFASEGRRTVFVSQVIDGSFPDWKSILPTDFKYDIELSKQTLVAAIKQALLVSDSHAIRAGITGDAITLTTSGSEGQAEVVIRVKHHDNPPVAIGFNGKFALDALDSSEEQMVHLRFNTQFAPMSLASLPDHINIIMPLKVE